MPKAFIENNIQCFGTIRPIPIGFRLDTWLDTLTLTWYSWKIRVSGPTPACAPHLPPHVRGFVDNIESHIRNSKCCMTIYNIDWIRWTSFVLDTTLTTFIGYGERLPCVSACGPLVLLDKDVGFHFILIKSWYLVQNKNLPDWAWSVFIYSFM